MKQKYKNRHRILKYLYEKIKDEPLGRIDLKKSRTNFTEIAEALNIDVKKLAEDHYGLHQVDDGHVCCEGGKHFEMTIDESGIFAYTDRYWLREGRKELNERIYDYTKWSLPILSMAISLFALYISLSKAPQQERQQKPQTQQDSTLQTKQPHTYRKV